MQNPLSGSRTTTPANEQKAAQGLTNPLTPNSQSGNMSTVGSDMNMEHKPEAEDTQSKYERIESHIKAEAGCASQIEHQGESNLGQGTGVLSSIEEPPRGGEEDKERISTDPSAGARTTTEPPSLPLASGIDRETTVSSSKKHEVEKREAAESLLFLNQGKLPKRKRAGPGAANSRASSKKSKKDSDELEYLGTRPVSRPLHPRRVTHQQDVLSKDKRRSAEQQARMIDGRNHITPNGSNYNMPQMPYPIGTVPLASRDFSLFTRPGFPPGMHTAAPSAPYHTRPTDYVYPPHSHPGPSSFLSSHPPIELQHGVRHQQQVAQMPVSDRNIEAIGRWRDFSHLNEAPAIRASHNDLMLPPYPGMAPTGPSGYPQNPESLVLMNLATRNAHLQTLAFSQPGAPHHPISRNVTLPPPTCTASTRYASLPTNFGALHLARGLYGSNTYHSTEYANYQQTLSNARAPVDLQRDLDFNHWRDRHSQKWVRKEGVHDGSGDYAAERLPKLVEPEITPTRRLAAMEAQGVNMGDRGAEGALKAGDGEVSREEVAGRGKRPWEL